MKQWKKDYQKLNNRSLDFWSVSEEICSAVPNISIFGNSKIYIENYNNILSFTREELCISSKCGNIRITGKCLFIPCYSNYYIVLEGQIREICYE